MLISIFRLLSVKIPKEQLKISFSRSSGPGGQNVNKVNSKVDIRFDLEFSNWLTVETKQRLKELYSHHMNKEGEFIVISQSNF